MSTGSTARPLGSRSSIPLLRYRSGSRASSRFSRSSHCFSSSRRAAVIKMVRQEASVLVSFRMREVLLPSSLSGKMRRMQPLSTCASVSFCTRCMERLTVKVPMLLAASKSMSSGVRPATSPSRSAPTSVRCTARCRMGSSMLSSAARISSTSQMLRSWVVFLGASTGTGLLMRMPHSTASRKELCRSWWTSWRVVPERVRFCCLGERSRRLPPTYCPQGVLLRVSYRASMW